MGNLEACVDRKPLRIGVQITSISRKVKQEFNTTFDRHFHKKEEFMMAFEDFFSRYSLLAKAENGMNFLHLALLLDVYNSKIDLITNIMQSVKEVSPWMVREPDKGGINAFQMACSSRQMHLIEIIIDNMPLSTVKSDDETHWIILTLIKEDTYKDMHSSVLDKFKRHGLKIPYTSKPFEQTFSQTFTSSSLFYYELYNFFLEHSPLTTNQEHETYFHRACKLDNAHELPTSKDRFFTGSFPEEYYTDTLIIRHLVKLQRSDRNSGLINKKSLDLRTPLHTAIEYKKLYLIRPLILEGSAQLNNSSPLDQSYVYFLYKHGIMDPEIYQLFLSRDNDANSQNSAGVNLLTHLIEELPNKLDNLSDPLEVIAVLSNNCKVDVVTRELKKVQGAGDSTLGKDGISADKNGGANGDDDADDEEEGPINYNDTNVDSDHLKWNILYGKNLLHSIFRREVLQNVLHRSSKNPDYDFFVKLLKRVREAIGNKALLRWLLMKNEQDLAPVTAVFQFSIPSKACALFQKLMEVCEVSVGFLYAFRQECIQHWQWEDDEMGMKGFYVTQQQKLKILWALGNLSKSKEEESEFEERALKGISDYLFDV